jgi:hypothetical protein
MPGHVKAGGKKEQDPDPSPWLLVTFEMKKEDSLKPYDAKKSVWVPDGEGGFDEAMIDEVNGDKVSLFPGLFKAFNSFHRSPSKSAGSRRPSSRPSVSR